MSDDYVLKYIPVMTDEGLKAHKKTPWPEGFNHYALTGDPSELKEYTLLKSSDAFWGKIEKEGFCKFGIEEKHRLLFKEALLKEMTRMLFSKNNMEFLDGGNVRQLNPIKNKLEKLQITPFFKAHLTSTVYQHLNEINSENELINFDHAENIADFFENILPLAAKASNDAISFVQKTSNADGRDNVRTGEVRYKFAQNLIRIYIKHLKEKPVSTDSGLYIFLYEESCKMCGFNMQNIMIAKDALKQFNEL